MIGNVSKESASTCRLSCTHMKPTTSACLEGTEARKDKGIECQILCSLAFPRKGRDKNADITVIANEEKTTVKYFI